MLDLLRTNRAVQIVAGAALLLLALAGAAAWWVGAPYRELEEARSRWLATPTEHDRMVVAMKGWGGCTQDAEVGGHGAARGEAHLVRTGA